MKKIALIIAVALGAMSAQAQSQALGSTNFGDNWSLGIVGGGTTGLKHSSFFGDMRGVIGIDIKKQISPTFGLGIDANWSVNTTGCSYAFDSQYVGLYGAANLNNLFAGYTCSRRLCEVELVAGIGWDHFFNVNNYQDWNSIATKVGINLNFNVSQKVTIALKPYFSWDLSDAPIHNGSFSYNANYGAFNILAGVYYNFGKGFVCVKPYDQAEVDGLNAQINDLRGKLDQCIAASNALDAKANALEAKNRSLEAELEACQNRKPEVVKEVSNNLNSVRYIFFRQGSSAITSDQKPNVEMIASYLKNHKGAKVAIKGYASPEGSQEINEKIARQRAEAVKNSLVKSYKISADRIIAEGVGVGDMFSEPTWNRVSICTIEDNK